MNLHNHCFCQRVAVAKTPCYPFGEQIMHEQCCVCGDRNVIGSELALKIDPSLLIHGYNK